MERPQFDLELLRLSDLAASWRGATETERGEIVEQYVSLLLRMLAQGFDEPLDVDSELPKRFMPPEYLR